MVWVNWDESEILASSLHLAIPQSVIYEVSYNPDVKKYITHTSQIKTIKIFQKNSYLIFFSSSS